MSRFFASQDVEKRKKNYVGSETTPHINQGKGDTLAQKAVSLLHQRRVWRDIADLDPQHCNNKVASYQSRFASSFLIFRVIHV